MREGLNRLAQKTADRRRCRSGVTLLEAEQGQARLRLVSPGVVFELFSKDKCQIQRLIYNGSMSSGLGGC